jgi:hypothetical protein
MLRHNPLPAKDGSEQIPLFRREPPAHPLPLTDLLDRAAPPQIVEDALKANLELRADRAIVLRDALFGYGLVGQFFRRYRLIRAKGAVDPLCEFASPKIIGAAAALMPE